MRTVVLAATIAVAGLVLAPGTRIEAQGWEGPAAFALRVTDDHGDPISGAEVRARASAAGVTGGPEPALTDELGQAVVGGLVEGEWFVEVSHPAYMLYAAYLDLEAGKKPQVGFSSQVNTETSWKPMTVKFFKASPELRRGSTTREQAPPEPPEVVRQVPPSATAEQPEPPEVVRPVTREPRQAPEATAPESAADRPAQPAVASEPEEVVSEPEEEAPAGEPVETTPTPPTETAGEPESETAPASEAPPATEALEEPAPEEPTPAEQSPSEPPSSEPAPREAVEGAVPETPPAIEIETEAAPVEAPAAAPEPPAATEAGAAVADRAVTPPSPGSAGEEEAAGTSPMGPIPRYLRSAAAGNCPECEAGEWAVASEQEAGPAEEPRSECSAEFVDGAARAARLLADSPAPRLEGWAGPILPAMWRLERERRDEIEDLLVPRTDPSSHCQLAGIVLPPGAQFSGYVLEAWDVLGGRSCRAGFDCAVGQSRWLDEPEVVEGSARTVVYGIFKNRSTRRERRARMTVYFEPPSRDWRPAVR